MPAESIRIRVDPETARAYREASPEQKERARSVFALSLRDRKEAAREFMAFMTETAREAESRGLTPEILDEILNEDPPGGAEQDDAEDEAEAA